MGLTYTEEGWCMSDEFDLEEYLNRAEYLMNVVKVIVLCVLSWHFV
jgi:hypothetical protein